MVTSDREFSRHPTLWWSSLGVTLSLGLPILGSIVATAFFPETRFANLPVHSLVETAGGLMALAIAGILVVEWPRKTEASHYLPMACALIGMGVLDVFHAAVEHLNNFVWLHSTATLVGGVLFAAVWLPINRTSRRSLQVLPWFVFATTCLFGVASCLLKEQLPAMAIDSSFTTLARVLNFTGGVGFLAAGVYFVRRFHRLSLREDWLFAMHTVLLGTAGLLFELSSLWDVAWWWWHALRLFAYMAALGFAARAYLDAERELLILNRQLDQTVAERTKELRANEERYELAVRGSTDGLWDWNVVTNEVYYAPRFKELLGYRDDEIRHEFAEFESRLHPDDHDRILDALRSHLEEQSQYDVEYRLRVKSGEYRWFRARGQAIWNDQGQPTRMAGSITDNHDRKLTEAALEHEKFLLKTLLVNLPEAIYFKDSEGHFLRVSSTLAARLKASSPHAVVGTSDVDFFPADYAAHARAEEQAVMRTGEPIIGREERPDWPDGTTNTVLTTKVPLRDRQGRIVGTFGISHDVSAIKDAEERFRLVVDATPNAILVVDRDGKIQLANRAATENFGYTLKEMIGATVELLLPERYREAHVRQREDYVRNPVPRLMGSGRELLARRKDGREFPAEIGLAPIVNDGDITVLVSIFDVTLRKQAQETLLEAKEAAERANQAKSDFLANMSHEIRTPMNAIIGMSELVLDSELSPAQRDYLTIVMESAEALLSIINEILDFSKIESGKIELESIDFDIREEVGDALKSLALRRHGKGLELAWHVHSDVPPYLRGDPTRLRQVLLNLIGNAIKFTHTGEVFLDVTADSLDDGTAAASLRFMIRDTGVGIPVDKLDSIFSAFEQADSSTTRQFGGTGLGLAITRRIIEALDGRIWVESEPGRGSTFFFTLTIPIGDAPPDAPLLDAPDLEQIPVLVVDDNPLNRRILRDMLESWGMPVTTVEGGVQAIAALQQLTAERGATPLLLTDVNMPEMDGFGLVQSLRTITQLQETVIIMLTSGGRPGDVARCEELGIHTHMMKPVKQSELLEAILMAVGRSTPTTVSDPPEEMPQQLPRLNVLLVEDGRANQRLARTLLEKWGHTVSIAENGQVGLNRWQQDEFDLILMDVQMPVMDGFEATRRIREKEQDTGRHIPIVAMTARALKGDREKCLAAGMDEYVSKPVRKLELHAAIAPFFTSGTRRMNWNSQCRMNRKSTGSRRSIFSITTRISCETSLMTVSLNCRNCSNEWRHR